jgi:uncharacterized protein
MPGGRADRNQESQSMLDFPHRTARLHGAAPPHDNHKERDVNAQDNKRIVMEGFRLFQGGDIPNMMALVHDDAEWLGPDAESVPFAGSFHGKAEVARFFAELGRSVQPMRFVVNDVVAENDKVVVIGEATWLVKSTGRSYEVPWVNVFTMRDDKIIRVEAFHDTAPAERAFRPDRPDLAAAANALRH